MVIKKGQGMVELIVAVGLIILVLSGAVFLMVNSINAKTKGFDRKKATELAQLIIERQVSRKNTDPATFFESTSVENQTETGFNGYTYSINYNYDGACSDHSCVTVKVVVSNPTGNNVTFQRFFAKI